MIKRNVKVFASCEKKSEDGQKKINPNATKKL